LSVLGGCGTSQITQTLTVLPLPTALISANGSLAICPGQSVTLSANSAQNISWTGGLTTQDITVSTAGDYILSVSNSCGISNDTVTVSVLPGVVNPSILSTGNVLCNGASLQLISDQQGGNSWSNGSSTDTITVTTAGTYILSYFNGCATGTDTLVVGTSALSVDVVAAPDSGNAPLQTTFTANSDSTISSYAWNIGGQQQSSSSQPNFTFETPGTYTTFVTVTDANGCVAVDSVNVIVLPELPSELEIANCFTPNGDGYNDYFKANALNLSSFDIQIFNRWGGLVYSGSSNLPGWDGTGKGGSAVPDGTYFYILKATGDDGKNFEKKGSVTLMR
jgi:gliding motility-associated-like protein